MLEKHGIMFLEKAYNMHLYLYMYHMYPKMIWFVENVMNYIAAKLWDIPKCYESWWNVTYQKKIRENVTNSIAEKFYEFYILYTGLGVGATSTCCPSCCAPNRASFWDWEGKELMGIRTLFGAAPFIPFSDFLDNKYKHLSLIKIDHTNYTN